MSALGFPLPPLLDKYLRRRFPSENGEWYTCYLNSIWPTLCSVAVTWVYIKIPSISTAKKKVQSSSFLFISVLYITYQRKNWLTRISAHNILYFIFPARYYSSSDQIAHQFYGTLKGLYAISHVSRCARLHPAFTIYTKKRDPGNRVEREKMAHVHVRSPRKEEAYKDSVVFWKA